MLPPLYEDLLAAAFAKCEIHVHFPEGMDLQLDRVVNNACYQALTEIQTILAQEAWSDFDCIEAIVRVLERMGAQGGGRHDFG